jgi:DMSO reductase anchor subunit
MRPEYSLIVLTVLAGAGQGLFFFIVTGDMAGFARGSRVPAAVALNGLSLAILFTLMGMAASFFHLSHKMRGIKAINKWRYSWLSREVILLPVFLGVVALYGLTRLNIGVHPMFVQYVGLFGVIVVFALYISTAMIYGHLKLVGEWGTTYTPVNFTLTGLITGGASSLAVYEVAGAPMGATLFNMRIFFALALAGLVAKLLYHRRNSKPYSSTTLQTALGINHPRIQLMDTGAAYPHYNTLEYHYTGLASARAAIRRASMALIYLLPVILIAWDYLGIFAGGAAGMAPISAAAAMAGAFLERWLFFVDGNHAQNLYYGNFPSPQARNPILQPAKKDAPLPPA